jgi:cell division protein FtsI/penicillin-binding protein 2
MTWGEVLVNSSNIGMAKVVERLSARGSCTKLVRRFGFGKPTGLGRGRRGLAAS